MKKFIKTAIHNKTADLVLKKANIIDVFNQCICVADIAIVEDKIVGIGKYDGKEEINCTGKYVCPAFIDSHVHIESSKVIPEIFSNILIKKGVTTCIADPHEIANVMGSKGIEFMIENSKNSKIDIYYMMPSCVPAVYFEDNGATLKSEDLAKFKSVDNVLGLGEVMNVPSVVNQDQDMVNKMNLFKEKVIDGHCPKINTDWLNGYILSGVKTDHECSTPKEALEKVSRGMYVMLREGSASRDLKNLLPAVNNNNFHRFLFCTDDKDITDLEKEGSVDYNVRLAIKNGLEPIKAITIATLNACECYGLKNKGAIAPGYIADLLILDNLDNIEIQRVIRKGKLYKSNRYLPSNMNIESSINMKNVNEDIFRIEAKGDKINVIKVIPNSIITQKVKRDIITQGKYVKEIKGKNISKIGVFERHKNTGKHCLSYIEGLQVGDCAVAQTICHDSHNVIVIGNNDNDMKIAVNRLIDIDGGIVLVNKGKVIEELSLPIAGLMTYEYPDCVIKKLNKMNQFIKGRQKNNNSNIFLTLSFMSLPVIPEIKITARGLYDYNNGEFIDLF